MHRLELDDKVCNVDKEHRGIAVIDLSSWVFSRASGFVSEPSTWANDSSNCFQVLWYESQTVNVSSCLIALSTPPVGIVRKSMYGVIQCLVSQCL
jgi:hypothetical protein